VHDTLGNVATPFATPDDPAVGDGFYVASRKAGRSPRRPQVRLPAAAVPVTAVLLVCVAPGDDVRGSKADLVVAPRTAVLLDRPLRADGPRLPAGRCAGDDFRPERQRLVVRPIPGASRAGAARHQAMAPPSRTIVVPVT
jgi:hypothetical protein